MAEQPIRLKHLLQQRHWQTYRTFCTEYEKAAKEVDPSLVKSWPSRAQLHRWLSGELKGLPYPDHCRVLEKMFSGWTATELFDPYTPDPIDDQTISGGLESGRQPDDSPFARYDLDVDVLLDLTEEDNRSVAQRIRRARSIFFAAHTGYNAMVSQYQVAVREAVRKGSTLRVVISDSNGPLMKQAKLTKRLCPSIRQEGEILDVIEACNRHQTEAVKAGHPADNVQIRLYQGPPSMNVLIVDGWLRIISYLPLLDAAESPVFEYQFDAEQPPQLIRKYLTSIERLWVDSQSAQHPKS